MGPKRAPPASPPAEEVEPAGARAADLVAEATRRRDALDARRALLEQEVEARRTAEYHVRRLERRRAELVAVSERTAEIVPEVGADLMRIARGRTFARMHRLATLLCRVRGRSARRPTTALDTAIERLGALEAQLRLPAPASTSALGDGTAAAYSTVPFARPASAARERAAAATFLRRWSAAAARAGEHAGRLDPGAAQDAPEPEPARDPPSADREATRDAFRAARPRPPSVAFVLPEGEHGRGGARDVCRLAAEMRDLGVEADVLAPAATIGELQEHDPEGLLHAFGGRRELERAARHRDVLVATHPRAVPMVAEAGARRANLLAAYHLQDCEPVPDAAPDAAPDGASDALRALEICASTPGLLVFADSTGLCDVVSHTHGLRAARVEPGVDDALLHEPDRPAGAIRVIAMVRPRARHQPVGTLMLLDRLKRDLGKRVEAITFGCTDEELACATDGWRPEVEHRGVLEGDEVSELLRAAHVFVDLSVSPALPRTGLEAMASGCAAVLPAIGAARELTVDGEDAVLVDPLDREAAYASLFTLVVDRARLERLQAAAVALARRRPMLTAVLSQVALFERELRALRPADRSLRTRALRR